MKIFRRCERKKNLRDKNTELRVNTNQMIVKDDLSHVASTFFFSQNYSNEKKKGCVILSFNSVRETLTNKNSR